MRCMNKSIECIYQFPSIFVGKLLPQSLITLAGDKYSVIFICSCQKMLNRTGILFVGGRVKWFAKEKRNSRNTRLKWKNNKFKNFKK